MLASLPTLLRNLRSRPWTSLLMVAMLALGIGASTAVFSFMAPILLESTGRVVQVFRTTRGTESGIQFQMERGLEPEELRAQQEGSAALEAIARATWGRVVLRKDGGNASFGNASIITASYFDVMGVRPILGRRFLPSEDRSPERLALLSHGLWMSLYDGSREALGQTLWVDSRPCTIVGVLPRDFAGHRPGRRLDVWLSPGAASLPAGAAGPGEGELSSSDPAIARLKPGWSPARAQAELQRLGSRFAPPGTPTVTVGPIELRPLHGDRFKALAERLPAPWLLLSASGLLLLLACANVTNLQLATLESRRREFAVRMALGATRRAILGQVLAENLSLSLAAGLLGIALARPILEVLMHLRDVKVYDLPGGVHLSAGAAAFALLLGLLSALATSLVPAFHVSRQDLTGMMRDSGAQDRGRRLKDGLVVLQVAMALALVACSTLILGSLERARTRDLGFRPRGVAGLRLEFPGTWDSKARKAEAIRQLQDRLQGSPGVLSVGLAEALPMEEGNLVLTQVGSALIRMKYVGPGYFATLGIPLMAGREFEARDAGAEGGGVLVNQAAARQFWPGEEALGKLVKNRPVIGVVADHGLAQDKGLHEPVVYRPIQPEGSFLGTVCLMYRSSGPPESLFPSLRAWVREADPDLAILRLTTLGDHLDSLYHALHLASWLLGFCGLASLCLAVMGVQSLLSFRVARQTHAIGIRMALGAQRGRVLVSVIAGGMGSVLLGLALGCLLAYWLAQIFHGAFSGVDRLDPGSLAAALGILLVASLLASLGPALRAASVDPSTALREE